MSAALPCRNSATFARAMVEADVLKPCHWRGSPQDSIQRAIRDLYKGEWFNMAMVYTDDIEREEGKSNHFQNYSADQYREHAKIGDKAKVGGILFRQNEAPYQLTIGPWMDKLEAAKAGLGESVLAIMRQASNAGFGIIDPCQAYSDAQNFHWEGETDHKVREKMLWEEEVDELKRLKKFKEAEALKPESIDMFRLTDFKLPRWALSPKVHGWFKKFQPNDLRIKQATLMQSEIGHQIIEAAHDALRAKDRVKVANDYGHLEYPSEYCCPFYVRWAVDDGVARIIDDGYEMEMQTGENHDVSYCNLFEWTDHEKMVDSIRNLPALLDVTYHVERIVKLCGTLL